MLATRSVRTTASRPKYVSLRTAAEMHSTSVRTIRRRIADGTIPGYRVGQQLRVKVEDLHRLAQPVPAVAGR